MVYLLIIIIAGTSAFTQNIGFVRDLPGCIETKASSPLHPCNRKIRSGGNTYSLSMTSRNNGRLSTVFRRPILSEDDLAQPPDSRVIQAVEKLGGSSVIASDVAAKAGVPISLARRSLAALAALTRGDIAVSNDGELLYTFPSNIRSVLSSNSARYRALATFEKIWPKLFFGIRVAFGVVLFLSIFAIFSTLFFVLSSSGGSRDDDRDDRRRGGGYGMTNFAFDLFYPRTYFSYSPFYGYYGRYDPYYTTSFRRYDGQLNKDDDPNIFERIFTYIFGDGDPNRGLENARLRAAADVIRKNGGAVVAEQLAPFLDVPDPNPDAFTDGDTGTIVDEGYVLPIVSQLGGEPTVTASGDIVYIFPDLQVSAESTLNAAGLDSDASIRDIKNLLELNSVDTRSALERSDLIQLLENAMIKANQESLDDIGNKGCILEEKRIEFNRNGSGWNFVAGTLGIVNLVGASYLGQVLSSPALQGYRLPAWYGLVQSSYPLLLIYALLFNIIPAGRYLYNKNQNAKIDERNGARRKWSNFLISGGNRLRRKLQSAKSLGSKVKKLGRSDAIYDTKRDSSLDLERRKEQDAMNQFDDLLNDENDANHPFQ
mmetsp:Transcript_6778/g.9765  ORF Transcript_6778/g.9765 Transcript_6778/m.9765 type:complete len:598 (+) Transcript_6778:54-1847(+)